MKLRRWMVTAAAATLASGMLASTAHASGPFVGPLRSVSPGASTVPANGDVNPYGVAVVPRSTGSLHSGNVLVSNFNASSNAQGTGTTVMQVTPGGKVSQFARINPARLPGACPGGVGLTTALSVLRTGWVVVGSLPTTDGTAATARAGCLLILDSHGAVRETFAGHGINGPWDMTSVDVGGIAELFVTNVLNGTVAAAGRTVHRGTVLRLVTTQTTSSPPRLRLVTQIGSGFGEHTDPAALVVGPTGVGLAPNGTLYVADTVANRITAIRDAVLRRGDAGIGTVVSTGKALNSPLGVTIAPGGDILTVNAGDGNLVETTPGGTQVAVRTLDASGSPAGSGALFGLAVRPDHRAVYYVDDATNTLNLLH
jgi:hypothetical protein